MTQNMSTNLITNLFRRKNRHPKSSNRKTKPTNFNRNDVLGGVYHTAIPSKPKPLQKQDSSSSFSTVDTISSEKSSISDGAADSWVSSGSSSHHLGAPLLVRSAISQRHLGSLHLSDEEILGRIMIKARHLPRAGKGSFVGNHVMINNERTKRTMVPLKRNLAMDEIAREHAKQMAEQQSLFYIDPVDLDEKLNAVRIGTNVGRGSCIEDIHQHMMASSISDKNNITDRRFVSMGVGTAKAANGTLYLCQIFSD